VALLPREGHLACPCCGASYSLGDGFVDLVPKAELGERTAYADQEFQERLHARDVEPLLSARVKADMMRLFLRPGPDESVLDLGCGPGKLALFTGRDGARVTGLDLAPFFFPRARRTVDLVNGDLRRLPFRKGSHPKAYSLDVLEHLDEDGVREVLVETRRVLGPGGRLFVYTHAMESSSLAAFQRGVNRLARRLGEAGLLDHEAGALKKSDHRNPIRSHEHFDELAGGAGLRVTKRRYYNVILKPVVEDLLLQMVEHRGRKGKGGGAAPAAKDLSGGRPPGLLALLAGRALSWLLKWDVVLFGGVRTGPFFSLLETRRP
jgi:SAM-dependent methyltransferase